MTMEMTSETRLGGSISRVKTRAENRDRDTTQFTRAFYWMNHNRHLDGLIIAKWPGLMVMLCFAFSYFSTERKDSESAWKSDWKMCSCDLRMDFIITIFIFFVVGPEKQIIQFCKCVYTFLWIFGSKLCVCLCETGILMRILNINYQGFYYACIFAWQMELIWMLAIN